MSENRSEVQMFFVGALITSMVGFILLIVDEFAGWYFYNGGSEIWVYINYETAAAGLLIPMAVMFLACFLIALIALGKPEAIPSDNVYRVGFYFSLIIFIITLIGGIAVGGVWASEDPDEVWFGTPFYGGLIAGLLTAIF